MFGTPQTVFSLDNPAGKSGMLYDQGEDVHLASGICGSVALDFGVCVEVTPGSPNTGRPVLQIAQGTSNPDGNTFFGITVYKDTLESSDPRISGNSALPYQPGDEVTVLKKGRIFAQCAAGVTVGVIGSTANFNHSSTLVAGAFGLITSSAVSGVAGSEVSTAPNGQLTWYKDAGLTGATPALAVVELNLP